jgi:hypothetical protein
MKDPHVNYKRNISPTDVKNRKDTVSIFTKRKYGGVVFKVDYWNWKLPSLGMMPYFMR